MKVCMFVLNDCNENYITGRKVARSLAAAGYDVRIIALLTDNTKQYEESDGARIFRIKLDPIHLKIIRALKLPVKLIRRVHNPQNKIEPQIPHSEGSEKTVDCQPADKKTNTRSKNHHSLINSVYDFFLRKIPKNYLLYLDYYYRSFKVARRETTDVYHAHDLVTLPVAWLCSRLNGTKVVYDSHELWLDRGRTPERSRINRFFVMKLESFLIRRTDANLIAGESSGKELCRRYHIAQPTVILNVPSSCPFEPSNIFRDRLGISSEEKILFYMGRISWGRGIEEEIESLKYLDACSLIVFGFGPNQYIAELSRLVTSRGLTKRVHFFPAVPFDEVIRHAMSADVGLVLHQNIGLNYYYVSPNKLFECMAAGLPVVGSNFPDLRRFIEGYKLGVTCDPKNPKEIADAVKYILSDENRYKQMRMNALEAAKIFNWENESKKLLAIYENLNSRKQ